MGQPAKSPSFSATPLPFTLTFTFTLSLLLFSTLFCLFYTPTHAAVDYELQRGDYLYKVMNTPGSWSESNTKCAAWKFGGKLASIWEEEENTLVNNMIRLSGVENVWIGAFDASQTKNYAWTDSSIFNYTNWAATEPNGAAADQCVSLNRDTSQWYDYECNSNSLNGMCKTVVSCNSVSTLDPTVCSSRGNCTAWNVCECNEPSKYFGTTCQYTSCNGVGSNSVSVCSSQGTCADFNQCVCSATSSGQWCESWECFGIDRTNSTHVCNGRGTCVTHNACSCNSGHSGTACELSLCYSFWSNDASVCSSHGACVDAGTCECDSSGSYVGTNCQNPACYGIDMTNPSSCGSNGTCMGPNSCSCDSGFGGSQCQYPVCGGLTADNPLVCNSNGTCISPSVCNCTTQFTGPNCEYPICNGYSLLDGVSVVCGGHGNCVTPDVCLCESSYYSSNCTVFDCNGIPNTNETVCSGNGLCTAPDVCTCHTGYRGENCMPVCFDILSNSTNVCSGNGQCLSPDSCACNSTHTGDQCQFPLCSGVSSNSSLVCSGHGDCLSADHCNCTAGYFGGNCSIYSCGGIMYTDPNTCGGTTACIGLDMCDCAIGYDGVNCDPVCYDVLSSNSTVCSGRGNCSTPNNCTCPSTHVGDRCEISHCFGILENNTNVCSGHGSCVDFDQCQCANGYNGTECNQVVCFGVDINDTMACGTHGTCEGPDDCACESQYFGDLCNVQHCFGVLSNISSVCSGNGTCVDIDNCLCAPGFSGPQCEWVQCFGNWSNTSQICSNRGSCVAPDMCQCQEQYSGLQCESYSCFGVLRNESSVCTSHGVCESHNHCSCNSGYYGSSCEKHDCFGTPFDNSAVCSSHGTCSSPDLCSCTLSYSGTTCDTFHCSGVLYNDSTVCSAKGSCNAADTCSCDIGYGNTQCQDSVCWDVLSSSASVCSSRGVCSSPNNCSCSQGYSGANCELIECFGVVSNGTSNNVCSGRGTCISPDQCSCLGPYSGDNCELYSCSGVLFSDPTVCSSNGTCNAPEVCQCNALRKGSTCEYENKCNGLEPNDPAVCSGRGSCNAPTCTCESGYFGNNCQLTSCFGVASNESTVCGGHGVCAALDTCQCVAGFSGIQCDQFECFGQLSSNQAVCGGRGTCSAPNTCTCQAGTTGLQCETRFCFGKINTDISVCSGRGTCDAPDLCKCTEGYSGADCSVNSCFGILSNSTAQCSSHGSCVQLDQCQCNGTWAGTDCGSCAPGFQGASCTTPFCDCLDRGSCKSDFTCECGGNFDGPYCRSCKTDFYGPLCNSYCNKETTCSGRGVCSSMSGVCECFKNEKDGFFDGPLCLTCVAPWMGSTCAVRVNETEWRFNANSDGIEGFLYHPIVTQSVDCELLIPNVTERSKLGSGALCQWKDAAHKGGLFEILFGANPTFLPNNQLTLDVFLNSSVDGSKIVPVIVQASDIIPVPVAHLSGPQKIGGCNALVLDGSLSTSSDRRGLTYSWDLLNGNIAQNISDLRAFLSTYTRSQLNVPSELIAPDFTYNFRMNVTTFLGKSASAQVSVLTTTDTVPIARVIGGTTRDQFSRDYIVFDGIMEEAPCLTSSQVKFSWEQTFGVKVNFATASGGRRLIIDGTSNALLHDDLDYQFTFTVSLVSNPAILSSATVTLRVKASPLTLNIAGGSSRQIGAGGNITLSTQVEGYSLNDVTFTWSCIDALTGGLCPNLNLLPTAGHTITVSSSMLPAGNYTFTVVGRRSSQIGTSIVSLQVVNDAVPQIDFQDHPPRINRQEKLILPSLLRLEGTGLTVTYTWSIKEGNGFWSQSQIAAAAFTPINNPVIGFKENSFSEGQTFEFTVRGIASNGASGFSSTKVLVNQSPKPGVFDVIPLSGQMITTDFSVSCSGWQDTDTPLSYSLKYIDTYSGAENPLLSSTLNPSFSTVFPVSGIGSSNTLTLVLYVTDSFGASTRVEKQLQVAPLPTDPDAFMSAMASSFTTQQNKLDQMSNQEKLSIVTLFSSALNFGGSGVTSSPQSQTLRTQLFDILSSVLSTPDGSAETASSVAQRTDMILKLSASGTLTNAQRNLATSVLLSAANSAFLSPDAARNSIQGLSGLISGAQNSTASAAELQALFDVGGALTSNLASQQVIGQPMTEITTDFLSIGVVKKVTSDLQGSVTFSGHQVQIPPMESVLTGTTDGVAIKLLLNALNPFPMSDNITSQILSLSFGIGNVEQPVQNLTDPIILDIPGVYNSNEYEFNVTKPGIRPVCRYWDYNAGTWSAVGGTFIEMVNNSATGVQYARCAFTHTTDFATAVEYVIPNINVPDVTRITELNVDNMTALIVILSFLLIYVILMVVLEILNWVSFHLRKNYTSQKELKKQFLNKTSASRARKLVDDFKKAHIWIGFMFPPTLGRSNFTRSMMLTVIMVSIVGILVSNALTFGQKQANFAQVITAAIFSDLVSTPFIVGFTILFAMVKRRKIKKAKPEQLSSEDLENPFGDESLNTKVTRYISFQEKQQLLSRSDPWGFVDRDVSASVDHRVRAVSMFSESNNINDVATPAVTGLILDEQDEYRDMNRFNSVSDIFEKRYNILMDALDDAIDKLVKWQKSMKRGNRVSKLEIAIFIVASVAYFSLVSLVNYCIITAISWIGERGAIIFTTLAIVAYFGSCVGFYLYAKYKVLSMIPPDKDVKVVSNAVTVVVLTSTLMSSVTVLLMITLTILFATGRWDWLKIDYFVVLMVGCSWILVLSTCLVIFSLYAPGKRNNKRKKEVKKKVKKSKNESGILPWWSRYFVYLLSWTYILAFSFLIVVYGIQFDSPGSQGGSSGDWILSSFFGLSQNVLLNKPAVYVAKVVILTSIGSMFNELAASSFSLDGFEIDFDLG